jgi:uncharacterized protein (DUF362 family)/NAD-dependent dihydropyrimidine dehydrogenase PreA subunit
MSTVCLIRCPTYEERAVRAAVDRGLAALGGVERFARRDEKILLKPNLLIARTPERAVTTHPAVFRAVAEALLDSGAHLTYGDSPGFGRTETAAMRAGISTVATELGIPLADFAAGTVVSFPAGRLIKQFTLARGVTESDGLISLSKMKTHGLTRITGAIKNQFGCIPGMLKAEFHARLSNADLFSRMLVDLNALLRPRLFVMDGITAMEGNGPQGGTPRPMNLLLFSEDPVALDTTFCRLVDLDPSLVPPIVHGAEAGLGVRRGIDWIGDPIEGFITRDFSVNRSSRSTTDRTGRPSRIARRLVVPRPSIRPERCTRCGTCVSVCPVTPKAVDFAGSREAPPVHHYDRCIRCYCCQEMCPESAIEIDVPLLGRFLHR